MKSFNIKYSKSASQVVFLYGSTILGCLLGILASMINTRVLSPENYGDFKYVQNVLNILGCVFFVGHFRVGGRLLALHSNDGNASRIRGALVTLLAITSFLTVLSTLIIALCSGPNLRPLFFAALLICCEPLMLSYLGAVLPGDNSIFRLSLCRFAPTLLYVIVAWLLFSRFGATTNEVLILHWGIPFLFFIITLLSSKINFSESGKWVKQIFEENREYGRDLYLGALILVGANYLAGITLGKFNPDNTLVGYYTLALTITYPLSMLPSIIGTAYFQKFATIERIPSKVLSITILSTLFVGGLFVLLIKPIVVFLYSDAYSSVGQYAQLMSLSYCLHGLGEFFERFLTARARGTLVKKGAIASGIIKIVGFIALVYFFGIAGALLTLTLSEAAYCIILAIGYNNYSNKGS